MLVVMLAAVTLLPAMLGFSGQNIDKFGIQRFMHSGEIDKEHTLSYRWSRVVQHHPWTAGGTALVILLIMASPLCLDAQSFTDAGNSARAHHATRGYDLSARASGPAPTARCSLVAPPPTARPRPASCARAARSRPDVAFVGPPRRRTRPARWRPGASYPKTSPQAQATHDLVQRTPRRRRAAGHVGHRRHRLVGGSTGAGRRHELPRRPARPG